MKSMDTTRKLALAAGVLYLVTFAASIPTLALKAPLVDHADCILGHGSDTGVLWGGFLDFVCAVAGIGTAVALYPITRRYSRTSAIGFVTSRTLEAAILVVGAISLLSVVTLRNDVVGGDTASLMTTSQSLDRDARLVVPVRPRVHARLQRAVPRHGDVPLPPGPPLHPADGPHRCAAAVRLQPGDAVRWARRRSRRPRCCSPCRSRRGSSRSACT